MYSSKSKRKKIALSVVFSSLLMGFYFGISAFSMAIDSNYEINTGSIFLTSETANSIIDPKEEEKANTFLSRGDGSSGINFIESFLERPATSIVEDEEEKININTYIQ